MAPNTQSITKTSNNGNAPQTAQDDIGNIQTALSQPDKVNQGMAALNLLCRSRTAHHVSTGPSKNVRGRPRPQPVYKQATTAGQNVTTGQIGVVSGPSTLQVPGPSVLQDGETDAFYGSPYEFQDLPGGGYLEINSDDERLTQTEPVLNHVAWGNAAYANIGRYSGISGSDTIFGQQWDHRT